MFIKIKSYVCVCLTLILNNSYTIYKEPCTLFSNFKYYIKIYNNVQV